MNYQQRPYAPMEFELAVECCKWAFAGGDHDSIARLAPQIDPGRFLALARRHRVQGLIWHSLDALDVPLANEISTCLRDDARRIAEDGLRAANEMARLDRAFGEADIACIFVKGLTVGRLAYSSPFMKQSWDIDVLVSAERISAAAAVLERIGYGLTAPALQARSSALERWHRTSKESVWHKPNGGMPVELHSGLADNARLIPAVGINSPRQAVEIAPGIILPTLAPDELFAYLCVHGASSAWFRLKWITDLAALLHGQDAGEIERLYRRSQELGAGRAAGQALLLAAWLYGTNINTDLLHTLETDPARRRLARIGLSQMTGRAATREPTDAILGTAMIHLSQFLLLPTWRFKASEFVRQISAIGA